MGLFWTLWFQVVIMGMMHCSQSFYVSLDFADGISVGIVVYGEKKNQKFYTVKPLYLSALVGMEFV